MRLTTREASRTYEIMTRLIYERRTWVNQLTSYEKVILCRAGLMTMTRPTDARGKSIYHRHAIYLWTERGRRMLDIVRRDLLKKEGAA